MASTMLDKAPKRFDGIGPLDARARRLARLKARRKLWLKVHLWLGLGLGLFLALIGLTGAVLVFAHELDVWLNPGLYEAVMPPGAVPQPLAAILTAAERAAPPGWESGGVEMPDAAGMNYVVGFSYPQPTPPPEEAVSLNIAVNPYTAEVVGRRVFYHAWNPFRHCFIGFFFKLHYSLLLWDAGVVLVGAMAVLFVVSALTGLILWWPLDGKWRRVLTLKRRAGPVRFNHDLHQTAGFYSLIVLLALLVSGLYFNLPGQFAWLVERFSPLTPEPTVSAPAPYAPQVDLDTALAQARVGYPGGVPQFYMFSAHTKGLFRACYRDVPDLGPYVLDSRCLVIDRHRGQLLQVQDPAHGSGGDVFMQWQWPVHSGQVFGWTGRILVCLTGLACPLLFATGLVRWQQKRRAAHGKTQRTRPSFHTSL
ncbi:Uncharacterized iron-regulated membrane protein [Methylomagnum ishizawai]|uniref:Uncharacterized iron-regulated membrane protein n=1 Tax=Methylomagnum ishizawai TaxID=1760988 RepID=A0A1Y6D4I0_9GAMM|nr:PepSY-associated TM helix domain-containing protein [Methylomagnum ishizawai]SMF97567.1 Uncharacterized iron-regulated membrane protein [Methylomagnum ishizawai]